tara:strand:- start:740 stop:1240 length:501 start_codon:yes stop_codon:yes gene_type:complete
MWIVIKYKKRELDFMKHDFKKILGALPVIFIPKIKYQKLIGNKVRFLEKEVLEDYLICYHEKFSNSKILTILKNLRGLKSLLNNSKDSQNEIVSFINYCKTNQGADGYLKQSFFGFNNINKGIFVSGPFTNMIFKVIENQKNKLKILIGNVTTTITKSSNYLYRSI